MINDKGILIKNIYYMLAYAFQALHQDNYADIDTEEFEHIHDLFASILSKGVSRQLKQGLHREYITLNEDLSVMRGRVVISGTIKNKLQQKRRLNCEYDELSENNIFNQIIKTTFLELIRCPKVKTENRSSLKKLILFFDNVDYIDPQTIRWNTIIYRRNNQEYRMLLSICYFVLTGLIITDDSGKTKMASFLDEQRMCRLYEKFILEYYRAEHKEIIANAIQIDWALSEGEAKYMLPVMQTDITLQTRDLKKTLIIDAKYYSKNTQIQYDKHTIHSNNLYQVFTYVKNLEAQYDADRTISGMLLYAKTEDQFQPDGQFHMTGNEITVRTLDLNMDFSEIRKNLDAICNKLFQKDVVECHV